MRGALITLVLAVVSSVLVSSQAVQVFPTTQPTTTPTTMMVFGDSETVTIDSVTYMVSVRKGSTAEGGRAMAGDVLSEGAEIRVGPRSEVRFIGEAGESLVVDRLATLKVFRTPEGKLAIGFVPIKYGPTRYGLRPGDKARSRAPATPLKPSRTLKVR